MAKEQEIASLQRQLEEADLELRQMDVANARDDPSRDQRPVGVAPGGFKGPATAAKPTKPPPIRGERYKGCIKLGMHSSG